MWLVNYGMVTHESWRKIQTWKQGKSVQINSTCTRRRLQLHRPPTNHAPYQKDVYYESIKIFHTLPKCIADFMEDEKKYVKPLRSLLIEQSFYSIDEFLFYCVTQMQWLCCEECILICMQCWSCLMNASYCVLFFNECVMCVTRHNCLSITNWYTPFFTSRTIGQISGSVKCKSNVM